MTKTVSVALALPLALSACTSIGGFSTKPASFDFGAPATLRVCVLRDPAVSEARAGELLDAWRAELAPLGIALEVPWTRPWPRPGQWWRPIMEALYREPLEAPCDRLLALIGRHAGDAAFGLVASVAGLPEFFGGVGIVTSTHGYVVAEWSPSLNQALAGGPVAGLVHEGYHYLGCSPFHDSTWSECYRTIRHLKAEATPEFFPGRCWNGHVIRSRAEVNDVLGRLLDGTLPVAEAGR